MEIKKNQFYLTNDSYLMPKYRFSPFNTSYISLNYSAFFSSQNEEDGYYDYDFFNGNLIITESGKSAINLALELLNLENDDYVTILTTSGNFYISSCVTETIERHCKWNRMLSKETKLIFIIHEFGFPFNFSDSIINSGIPIIEDCAYSYYSQNKLGTVGIIGDFVIYSLPKIFPVNYGGILKINNKNYQINNIQDSKLFNHDYTFLKKIVNIYNTSKSSIIEKRIQNYNYLLDKLGKEFKPRFEVDNFVCPGALVFETPNYIDLSCLKKMMQASGVECTVFYGEQAFILPIHQNLNKIDLDYISSIFHVMKAKCLHDS